MEIFLAKQALEEIVNTQASEMRLPHHCQIDFQEPTLLTKHPSF